MPHFRTEKRTRGFSLIELLIAVAVVLIVAAMAVPQVIHTAADISLRYAASDFSGLLQSARIQAVRKNTYYTVVQGTLSSGSPGYFLDLAKTGLWVTGDPDLPPIANLTIHPGTGSGAPNEGTFISSLNFTVNPGGDPPSFNARGLPCIAAANACPQTPGQGFVIFMSKPVLTGNVPWVAVVVTASGHIQTWSCDNNGNWVQRD